MTEACVLSHYGTLLSNLTSSVNSQLLAHIIFLSILYQRRRTISKECIFRGLMHSQRPCLEEILIRENYSQSLPWLEESSLLDIAILAGLAPVGPGT